MHLDGNGLKSIARHVLTAPCCVPILSYLIIISYLIDKINYGFDHDDDKEHISPRFDRVTFRKAIAARSANFHNRLNHNRLKNMNAKRF